jgi:hypothetical protein
LGSGALAIDFYRHGNPSTHSSEGHLMVAEWGEGRIVRLEETTGARTPLALHVPSFHCRNTCRATSPGSTNDNNNGTSADSAYGAAPNDSCWKRIPNIERMLLTPMGDLLLAVNHDDDEANVGDDAGECASTGAIIPDSDDNDDHAATATPSPSGHSATASLVVLSNAVHVPPIASLHESRQAHAWTEIPNGTHPTSSRILYSDASVMRIGGIVFNSTTSSVYMTAMRQQHAGNENRTKIVLLEYPLLEDSDEEEDDEDDDVVKDKSARPKSPAQARTLVDLDVYAPGLQRPGALVVAQSGRMFISVHDGVLIVDQSFGVLGKVLVPLDEPPTALSLGGDGYLYVASKTRLYRIRTREQIATHETNRVRTPPKYGTTTPANR